MRKIFTLFAAMLVALTVSAANVWNITNATENSLFSTIAASSTQSGDTIVMAAGTYTEGTSSDINVTKSIVVKAATGANVIIQSQLPILIKGGSRVEFIGVKFDATNLRKRAAWPEHILQINDATDGNKIILEGCDFYNDTINSSAIYCPSSYKLDSCNINNCYFHDIKKSCIFLENAGLIGLSITNSTFAKISSAANYHASTIYTKTTTGKVLVDHCTFYDCLAMDITYGTVYAKTASSTVTNSIFMLGSLIDLCATNLPEGGVVRNCITYLYNNWQPCSHMKTATVTACLYADPKFQDAAKGDFTLTAGSPALDYAGKDAESADIKVNLGDPRWVPAPKTLYCEMKEDWWTAAGAAIGCYAYYNEGESKNAEWPGVRMTPTGEDGVWTYDVSAKYDHVIFTRMNPSDEGNQDWGYQSYDLAIPEQWDYYTITATSKPGDKKAAGEWKKRNPILENGWYLVGTFDGVEEKTFETLTAEKLFIVNPENENEYIVTANLTEGDKFKAAYVYYDQINDYKPNGVGDEYVIDEWHTGVKTIVYNQTYQEAWGGYFYIAPNEPVFTYSDFEIDLRNGQLGTEGNNMQKYLKVGDPYVYYDQQPVESNARLNAARFNSTADPSHGYVNFVATIPVVAGNYKITVGNCTYNNTNGAVKNEAGTETLNLIDKNGQTITAIETPKNCYHQNTTENVTSVWFVAEAAQTIQIVCPQYAPYIKVEQVAEVPEEVIVYSVTFAHAEGATGVLPANLVDLAPTTAITLPKNTSMYKEGYTFDGWTDGKDLYDPGFEYEVTDDVTFTAVYAENTVSLADRTAAVTIKWEFSQSKGVAPINVSGATTFVVAQATIGAEKIDVKLPIDATVSGGKFVNSANSWTQINPGVIFSIPSAKDAVITYKQYDNGDVTTPEINVSATDATYNLIAAGTSGQLYYEYVQVVLPDPTATGIDNTVAGEKAVKVLRNGQLFIEKNGKTYNVLGTIVK